MKYNSSGKLTVRGENFDVATKLFVDSREQTASFKADGRLIVKKLKLSAGMHEIRVVNKDGQISTSTLVVNR